MNHDVNGSGECAQCANPDLKGLHSCERESMRSRLGQASAEPTFSYANGSLDDAETLLRRAQDAVMRQALTSEAKAHVWEHKTASAQAYSHRKGQAQARTFTREEVLAVIKARKASQAPCPGLADVFSALDHLILVFERME